MRPAREGLLQCKRLSDYAHREAYGFVEAFTLGGSLLFFFLPLVLGAGAVGVVLRELDWGVCSFAARVRG